MKIVIKYDPVLNIKTNSEIPMPFYFDSTNKKLFFIKKISGKYFAFIKDSENNENKKYLDDIDVLEIFEIKDYTNKRISLENQLKNQSYITFSNDLNEFDENRRNFIFGQTTKLTFNNITLGDINDKKDQRILEITLNISPNNYIIKENNRELNKSKTQFIYKDDTQNKIFLSNIYNNNETKSLTISKDETVKIEFTEINLLSKKEIPQIISEEKNEDEIEKAILLAGQLDDFGNLK